MLEKFIEYVNNSINKQEEQLMQFKKETVEEYFELEDYNKWLKYNAMNEEQLKNAISYEKHLKEILEKLYVPNLQTENV